MRTLRVILAGLGIMVLGTHGLAEIHRWTDADGRVHFGDRPPIDASTEVIEVRPNVYTHPEIVRNPMPATRDRRIVLYSASWCGHCDRAREYMRQRGVAFDEYDVETSTKGRRDYARLGARGVPVLLVGDRRLNGFSKAAFEAAYEADSR